jgi:hypothetical protein
MAEGPREELPEWPAGTVAVLATGAGPPHAIPVSAVVRAGPRRALVGLARDRESLARLRREPRAALTILAAGDVAVTAHVRATVLEEVTGIEGVIAVLLEVESLQDHGQPRFEIEAGVRWRWTDADAERRDGEVRAALARMAGEHAGG